MSDTNSTISSSARSVKSFQGFEEGTYAARKGRLCYIKKIHFELHPPSVTVKMMDTGTEVGTEFDRLQHIESWLCHMCTAQNHDANATKCFFCGLGRNYKEQITALPPGQAPESSAVDIQSLSVSPQPPQPQQPHHPHHPQPPAAPEQPAETESDDDVHEVPGKPDGEPLYEQGADSEADREPDTDTDAERVDSGLDKEEEDEDLDGADGGDGASDSDIDGEYHWDEESEEEPQPKAYRPSAGHRPEMPYYRQPRYQQPPRYAPHRPSGRRGRKQRDPSYGRSAFPQSVFSRSPFPTFWPSQSLFDW